MHGKLIGIVNSKIASSSYDNVGYAIPSNVAVSIADQVISQCDGASASSSNTRVKTLTTRNIGFSIENGESSSRIITNASGKNEWYISYNVLVTSINDTSTSYAAGIRANDIIIKVKFSGQTYTANEYFNKYYELNDLLLNVGISCGSIEFTIQRVEGDDLVEHQYTVVLSETNFVEIA